MTATFRIAYAILAASLASGCIADADEPIEPGEPGLETEDEWEELGFAEPDLEPLHPSTNCDGYFVKNTGNSVVPATTLRVRYSWRISLGLLETETQYFAVPSLWPGMSEYFDYYPEACFDSDLDCDFSMKADYWNGVNEVDEVDNTLTRSCKQHQ
jgi:hypothetical protein